VDEAGFCFVGHERVAASFSLTYKLTHSYMEQPTLFEKIIAREIPADIVYEDADVVAFLDINPVNVGHTLVVPRKPFVNMLDMDEATASAMTKATQKIARAVLAATGAPAYNLEVNNGSAAGQLVMHAHWHIIPRFADDGLKHWAGKPYGEGESAAIAAKIISVLD